MGHKAGEFILDGVCREGGSREGTFCPRRKVTNSDAILSHFIYCNVFCFLYDNFLFSSENFINYLNFLNPPQCHTKIIILATLIITFDVTIFDDMLT